MKKLNEKMYLEEITDLNIELFNDFNTLIKMKNKYKHSEIRNLQGDIAIIKSCNYDIDLIKLFFKTNSTANNSKYLRHYKKLMKAMKEIESKNSMKRQNKQI